jgi:hypothetical protein
MPRNSKEYNHDYYIKNKDRILENISTLVRCECGCKVQNQKLERHKKSTKHQKLLNIGNRSVEFTAAIETINAAIRSFSPEDKKLIKKAICV